MTKMQYLRQKKSMTQFDLAVKTGISIQSIRNYEQKSGALEACNLKTLVCLCMALQAPIDEIIEDEQLKAKMRQIEAFKSGPERESGPLTMP